MLCRNPYLNQKSQLFPCGQCMPCRVNRVREWTHRLMLEQSLHSDSVFLTLTYTDEKLPRTSTNLPTLDPKHLKDWLKRLRDRISPSKVRFFAVGEYGDETFRPHYHVALFGYPACSYGNSRYTRTRQRCCDHCDLIRDTWGRGAIFAGDLSVNSAQYIVGYVAKKLTDKSDPRLNGRHPEFARMSLKPGIGRDFMDEVASVLLGPGGGNFADDVPTHLAHGTRKFPLGRYLRRRLRELTGRDQAAPESAIQALQEELQPLREAAFNASKSFKQSVIDSKETKVGAMENRARIFKQRKTL